MTKQEEIGEGMATSLAEYFGDPTINYDGLRAHIIQYLHSQGVVIKVEKELPKCEITEGQVESYRGTIEYGLSWCGRSAYLAAQNEMLKAGYVAVEPLVKDETT